MKSKFLIPFLLLLIVSAGCEKHRIKRKYTGDFTFAVSSSFTQINQQPSSSDYSYNGEIELYKPSASDGLSEKNVYLKIHFRSSGYVIARVENDGTVDVIGATSNDCHFVNNDLLKMDFTFRSLSTSEHYIITANRR